MSELVVMIRVRLGRPCGFGGRGLRVALVTGVAS